jgi:hypothetical protein
MEIQYSQFKINHLNDTPSSKAAGGGIFSGVFQQGRQGTSQGQEDFELSWYLFFQQWPSKQQRNFQRMILQSSLFDSPLAAHPVHMSGE